MCVLSVQVLEVDVEGSRYIMEIIDLEHLECSGLGE
jgi:hypothetical protein